MQPADMDLWLHIQPEPARRHVPEQPAGDDLRPQVQPELARCHTYVPADMGLVDCFEHRLQGLKASSSLWTLTFGYNFDQSLERVAPLSSRQSWTFGHEPDQSLRFYAAGQPADVDEVSCWQSTAYPEV